MKHLYKVTQAVSNNMQRGIALKNKYNKRKSASYSNTVEQVKKAEIIFSESELGLTLDSVKEIYNVLTKLEKSVDFRKRLEDKGPTEEIIKFYAYGGSSGLAWSRMILKEQNIVKSHRGVITEADINKDGDDKTYGKIQVAKAVNDELMQATFVVMVPDEIDAHGDVTSVEEVRKACHNFNKYSMQANLFHLVQTDTFEFAESFIAPVDMAIGDKLVTKGTWLCTIQCLDDGLWALIKSGEVCGVSIGALASIEQIEGVTNDD
jgi:hypothetical protein